MLSLLKPPSLKTSLLKAVGDPIKQPVPLNVRNLKVFAFFSRLDLPLIEVVLLAAFVLSLLIGAIDTLRGENLGDNEAVKLAKHQAQDDMVAQTFQKSVE